jgi:hypothetical protein
MEVLLWITTALLVVGVGGVAVLKLSGNEEVVKQAHRLGYEPLRKPTAVAELLGVAGVAIGAVSTDLKWIGVLAAIGIAAMMIGAIVFHRRAGDIGPTMPSILMLLCAVLYIVAQTRL